MDDVRRTELVIAAIDHTVNREPYQATAAMVEIFRASDGKQMYGVCCALAEAARQTLVRLYGHQGPETLWALAAPDPNDGPCHPAHTFSLRFITAFANEDMPTCQALYMAACRASGDDFAHSVSSLLRDVAELARHALEVQPGCGKPATHPH